MDKKYNKILETAKLWTELKELWQRVKTNSVTWDGFEELIEQINKLRARVGDKSNLILDPDLNTYYLMDANLIKLPSLRLTVSQLHSLLESSEVDVIYVNSLAKVVEVNRRELLFNLDTGFNNNPKGMFYQGILFN
ncbi:MAG: hypothetical protein ACK4QL_00070 [Pseudanabaenaceae cyanobacterium]